MSYGCVGQALKDDRCFSGVDIEGRTRHLSTMDLIVAMMPTAF